MVVSTSKSRYKYTDYTKLRMSSISYWTRSWLTLDSAGIKLIRVPMWRRKQRASYDYGFMWTFSWHVLDRSIGSGLKSSWKCTFQNACLILAWWLIEQTMKIIQSGYLSTAEVWMCRPQEGFWDACDHGNFHSSWRGSWDLQPNQISFFNHFNILL